MGHSEKHLDFYNNDIGKKVFTIEEEVTTVVKWQVKAKDSNEAFEKWLNCSSEEKMENMMVKDNGDDVVCTYAKEYSKLEDHGTEIGTIIKEDEEDEDSDIILEGHGKFD